ncbi:hypothetical protein PSHI8_24170 [Polynucleobacter sp. SHI8]|nr:hypothetical protein PSHI2_24150 [Polynucleobacter sp. SHI2]BDW14781.1 hypothetical protein PSHI8_24170 [Polynucleobacter sp. SHI8]
MRYLKPIFYIVLISLVLTGCAHHYAPEEIGDPYGFLSGLWHGYIVIFSFLGWLFLDDVYIIGQPNTGLFYYIGFVMGVMGFFGSANQ